MPISPYVRHLRRHVGSMRLLLPSVSAHIFDQAGRLLLVQQRETGMWSTPGGSIEPDERPADAVVRETWEETGLLVTPCDLIGVFGGPEFVVQYDNGDEAQYVILAFDCEVVGGTLQDSSEETVGAKYFTRAEASEVALAGWLRHILDAVYGKKPFERPTWSPAHDSIRSEPG